MNRRTFVAGTLATAAVAAVPGIAEAQATPDVSPGATPIGVHFIQISRTYKDDTYATKLYTEIVYISSQPDLEVYFDEAIVSLMENDDNHYLTKLIEDALVYGDESATITWRVTVGIEAACVIFRQGLLSSYFMFVGETVAEALEIANTTVSDLISNREYKVTYTDEELFALLPTEEEVGLTLSEETYNSDTYFPEN